MCGGAFEVSQMSSVIKKNQKPHRFTTSDLCLNLYDHTSNVLANPKFDKCRALADRADYRASMIYHCCRSANEDYDNRIKEEAEERLRLQAEALKMCRWLKTDIRLLQRKLHLRAKKCIYWNGLVNIAMESIKAWHISEKRNYIENFGS